MSELRELGQRETCRLWRIDGDPPEAVEVEFWPADGGFYDDARCDEQACGFYWQADLDYLGYATTEIEAWALAVDGAREQEAKAKRAYDKTRNQRAAVVRGRLFAANRVAMADALETAGAASGRE